MNKILTAKIFAVKMTLWPEHGEILGQLYREVGKAENEARQ